MADVKLDISPMYEGERIRKEDLWIELGGPKTEGFELSVAGERSLLKPGMVAVVPSNVKHQGRALTACRLIDAFYPVREEYRGK